MKYLEFTFRTSPCTETVNDVLAAILGDAGFESFVEQEDGIAAYIQKDLYDETTVKTTIAEFYRIQKLNILLQKLKTKIGTRNGKRISFNRLLLVTVASFTALSITMFPKLNMTS